MPGETMLSVAADTETEEAAVEKNWTRYWDTNVVQKAAVADQWEKFKLRDSVESVMQGLSVLYNQADLWESRAKGVEQSEAVNVFRSHCIMLLRYIELAEILLCGTGKHPVKLPAASKKQLKANLETALNKLAKSKPRVKAHVSKQIREQLRANARADTTMVGDALDGNRSIMNLGDAVLRESLAQVPGGGAGRGGPPRPTHMPLHPAQPQFTHPVGATGFSAGDGMQHGSSRGRNVDAGDDVVIAVPADDGEIPNLLPDQNRMNWNTFLERQRPPPGQKPHWQMPPQQAPHGYNAARGGIATAHPVVSGSHGALPRLGVDPYDAQLQEALRQSSLLAQRENEKTARLKERLERYTEYELEEVDNTGHCQFDSLAHQISGRFPRAYPEHCKNGTWYHYRQVRKDIANWLRLNAKVPLDNGETISDFHDEEDGATWDDFCDNVEDIRMSPAPLWGNHLTLIAAANCYQRPIRVWSTAPGDDWWLQIEPKHYKATHNIRPFELAHLYERHYLSVTERKGPKRSMQTTPL